MWEKEYEILTKLIINNYYMFNQYCVIYNYSDKRYSLLNKVARYFFEDLRRMWQEHILLDICKMTDSIKQFRNNNLTIYYIVDKLKPIITPEQLANFNEALRVIEETRSKVIDVRSKIIAHIDHDVIIKNKLFGDITWEEINTFYNNVQVIVNLAGQHIGRGPWSIQMATRLDAEDLVEALKKGVHYDRLLLDRHIDYINEKTNWEYVDA